MTTVQSSYLEADIVRPEVAVQTTAWPQWGAILMGAVSAIGLQLIFAALGIALGLTIATSDRATTTTNVGMVATLWWLVTGWVSLMVGGLILGRILRTGAPQDIPVKTRDYAGWRPLRTGRASGHTACLNAMTLWSVVAIFGFLVLWSGLGMGAGAAAMMPLSDSVPRSGSEGGTSPVLWQDPRDTVDEREEAARTGRIPILPENAPPFAQSENPNTRGAFTSSPRPLGARYISQPHMMYVANDEIRRTARAASWWSVVGLIVGIGAVWGGATAGLGTHIAPVNTTPGRR